MKDNQHYQDHHDWLEKAHFNILVRCHYAECRLDLWEPLAILSAFVFYGGTCISIGFALRAMCAQITVLLAAVDLMILLLLIEAVSHSRFWHQQKSDYADLVYRFPDDYSCVDDKLFASYKDDISSHFKSIRDREGKPFPALLALCANELPVPGKKRFYPLSWIQTNLGRYLPIPCHAKLPRKSRAKAKETT